MANPKDGGATPSTTPEEGSIDAPRLTPQGRTDDDPTGEDATDPSGTGAKQGQSDKAEG